MVVHQIFAIILDGEIKNIMICDNYEVANQLARATQGDAAIAVDCTQYPCEQGDKYENGVFSKADGTEIIRVNTPEEDVAVLKQENAELTLAVASLLGV